MPRSYKRKPVKRRSVKRRTYKRKSTTPWWRYGLAAGAAGLGAYGAYRNRAALGGYASSAANYARGLYNRGDNIDPARYALPPRIRLPTGQIGVFRRRLAEQGFMPGTPAYIPGNYNDGDVEMSNSNRNYQIVRGNIVVPSAPEWSDIASDNRYNRISSLRGRENKRGANPISDATKRRRTWYDTATDAARVAGTVASAVSPYARLIHGNRTALWY